MKLKLITLLILILAIVSSCGHAANIELENDEMVSYLHSYSTTKAAQLYEVLHGDGYFETDFTAPAYMNIFAIHIRRSSGFNNRRIRHSAQHGANDML